jgi:hypothetical protein
VTSFRGGGVGFRSANVGTFRGGAFRGGAFRANARFGRNFRGRGFVGGPFFYGVGYPGYYYGDGCYQTERVWDGYGYSLREVYVCDSGYGYDYGY